ncbi:MAG: SHOCT domain-containing protein [Actinobacteria bacterium]|nr:SHOCT domain-containing protein [Actinomycetota bacterium]
MPLATIGFGEALLLVVEVFLFVAWIWILVTIVSDLFRDHEMSGWGKAAWIVVLVLIPFLGALIYLVARGDGMRRRTIEAQLDAKRHFDDYIREQSRSTPASDLEKLDELRRAGVVSEEEFAAAKARLLG